ncbi:hypothetical protein MRB53_016566 [Persea americana]|uniref:Uncharacterized protein n=1 Tax=Persea americana TaxID=3435 RepID=A0ACC2M3U3_PERAE|nr:hypothetical protein MRB53_016566 [Persea americana]
MTTQNKQAIQKAVNNQNEELLAEQQKDDQSAVQYQRSWLMFLSASSQLVCNSQMYLTICCYVSFCRDQCRISHFMRSFVPIGNENRCPRGWFLGHHAVFGIVNSFCNCPIPTVIWTACSLPAHASSCYASQWTSVRLMFHYIVL